MKDGFTWSQAHGHSLSSTTSSGAVLPWSHCAAEQQPASKGSGSAPVCRLWSPHSLHEVAYVQVPSRHDVAAAHFSHDGNVLLLLLADAQHSLAVYFLISIALQGHSCDERSSLTSSGFPVLHATHVVPCTRSLLNGLTLEGASHSSGQNTSRRGRGSGGRLPSVISPRRALPGDPGHAVSGIRCSGGAASVIRFATFGLGHLRVWNINWDRPFQPPSYRSLCISRTAGGGGHNRPPEVTACAFLTSGDIIAALADRRIVLFRGLTPLRSVSLPSCSSRVLLLQPFQRSLLLLVAQEGLIQLLPLSALTTSYTAGRALPRPSSSSEKAPQHRGRKFSGCVATPSRASPVPDASVSQRTYRHSRHSPCATTPRSVTRRLPSATRPTAVTPPFATGSLHAPTRTPRSTYGDSVGWWYAGSLSQSRRLRSAGSRGSGMTGRFAKTSLARPPSADSRTSTRSSAGSGTLQPDRQQRHLQMQRAGNSQRGSVAASLCEMHPKRSLTIQKVATRHMRKGYTERRGCAWLPLHNSQIVALHWCEPRLLLCTRTQIIVVDASHLSEETSAILQERPLGSLDVTALLRLSVSPAGPALPYAAPESRNQAGVQLSQPPGDWPCVAVAGGRCCVGGELRLWELHSREQSSTVC